MSELKDRIKEAANEVGGLNKLAELTGTPRRTLGHWVDGSTEPKAGNLAQIAAVAGVSANWLLLGKEPKFDDGPRAHGVALDNRLLDRLGRAALQVYGDMDRTLPHAQVAGEAALLYNELVAIGVDLEDAEAIEASIPLLQLHLKRRLEQAAADPATDKRRA